MASQKGLAVLAGSFILRGPIDEVCSSCSVVVLTALRWEFVIIKLSINK